MNRRPLNLRALICSLAATLPLTPALCAEPEPERHNEPTVIETIRVNATRLPESVPGLSQSPILLPSSAAGAPRSMSELLGSTPSVHTDTGGGPGGFSSLYLRGADPSHTVIMIDGIRVSDPTNARGGGIDLSLIDPRTVSRVEILPGASSAIYGADAMAGAINIVTVDGDRTGLRLGTGFGEGGYRNAFVSGGLRSDLLSFQGQAAATNDQGVSGSSSARLRTASVRLRMGDPGGRHATARVRVQDAELAGFPEDSGGPLFAVNRDLERRDTHGVVASLSGEIPASWGTLKAYTSVFNQDAEIRSPGVEPGLRDPAGLPASNSRSEYRRSSGGATATFDAGQDAVALVGIQYDHEEGDVRGSLLFPSFSLPSGFSLDRTTRSVFAEGRLKLGSQVAAQAGLRSDDIDGNGTRRTFSTALTYQKNPQAPTFAASLGTGFKPPSFFALGNPLVGNPGLRPETSRTVELSIGSPADIEGRGRIGYRAAIFRSDYRDLVDFDPGPPPQLVNRSEVRIDGLELTGTSRPTERLDLRAGLTLLDIRTPSDAPPLRSRPRMRATVATAWRLAEGLTGTLSGSWIGRAYDSSVPTGSVQLSRYMLLDASVTRDLGPVRVTFAVSNLLDKEYQQLVGFPGAGRRVRLEVATAL